MTQEDRKKAMYNQGRADAQALQAEAENLTGTELNEETGKIPDFQSAVKNANLLTRLAGFVCKSTAGRVVKLLQPYDSDIYTGEPEELPAQWGFQWSQDPAHAKPFVAISTSPYNKGDCCSEDGAVYRSTMDGNVWAPSEYKQAWEAVE